MTLSTNSIDFCRCRNLKTLGLPSRIDYNTIPKIICKWKNLESLTLHNISKLHEILTQISIHCNNFVALCVMRSEINKQEALAIVELLPNLKSLSLTYDYIARESLLIILKGCRELVEIDVRGNYGFEVDDEMFKLASHINDFKYENSLVLDAEEIFSTFILGYGSSSSSNSDGFSQGPNSIPGAISGFKDRALEAMEIILWLINFQVLGWVPGSKNYISENSIPKTGHVECRE
ncbi:hypothetical protein LguiB_026310 [Lonicera macranthoides]